MNVFIVPIKLKQFIIQVPASWDSALPVAQKAKLEVSPPP